MVDGAAVTFDEPEPQEDYDTEVVFPDGGALASVNGERVIPLVYAQITEHQGLSLAFLGEGGHVLYVQIDDQASAVKLVRVLHTATKGFVRPEDEETFEQDTARGYLR